MKSFDRQTQSRRRFAAMMSTTALSTVIAVAATSTAALAQTAAKPGQTGAAPTSVEEVVVTGTRIVREGYEAPTPLTVVGAEQLQTNASANITDYLNSMPAISGNRLSSAGQVNTTTASAGAQSINLRSLGGNRTLVLYNGQRVVGLDYDGSVHTGTFPDLLIQRVDVVTGGASAVYGSDAVSGVVNFVLDTNFTGVKGNMSAGITNLGDDFNYKFELAAGVPFADDRGHFLISATRLWKDGIHGDGGREWNHQGIYSGPNPAYTATNGQPRTLVLPQGSQSIASLGGLVISGPLKGTAFGEGGKPYQFGYGAITGSSVMWGGGDWQSNQIRYTYWLDSQQNDYKVFTRVGYDITDNINAWVQYDWAQNHSFNNISEYWIFGNAIVKLDNAYLPAATRAAMVANNVTQLAIGTFNKDLGPFGPNNNWLTNRVYGGFKGNFDAFDTNWKWDLTYGYGSTKQAAHSDWHPPSGDPLGLSFKLSAYVQAVDAVVNPANGKIVCRITLTSPNSDAGRTCKPWNVMGVGVNNLGDGVPSFMTPNYQYGLIEQTTYSGSVTGEPFSVPAGPVSLAFSAAWRGNEIHSTVDIDAINNDRPNGRHSILNGKTNVTEGAIETVIPLVKGESWAEAWDLNAAVRFTSYQISGFLVTWKAGMTYTLNDQVKFRLTRSRDIREPTLQDLYAAPNISIGTIIDPFRNNAQYTLSQGAATTGSNPNLTPEKADTWGGGVILTPSFLDGFTMSADFWDVDISNGLFAINGQRLVDSCFKGYTPACAGIVRDPNASVTVSGTAVVNPIVYVGALPLNLASQEMRGIDLEATWTTPVDRIVSAWAGSFRLHGVATFYLSNWINNTFDPAYNDVGGNAPSYPNTAPPHWKAQVSATYALDPWSLTMTGRAISSGVYNTRAVECSSGCPAIGGSVGETINNNHEPGAFYLDANFTYNLKFGENTTAQFYASAQNITDRDPPWTGGSFLQSQNGSGSYYDSLGVVYRVGLSFKM